MYMEGAHGWDDNTLCGDFSRSLPSLYCKKNWHPYFFFYSLPSHSMLTWPIDNWKKMANVSWSLRWIYMGYDFFFDLYFIPIKR